MHLHNAQYWSVRHSLRRSLMVAAWTKLGVFSIVVALFFGGCGDIDASFDVSDGNSSLGWVPEARFLQSEEGRDARTRFIENFPGFERSNMYYDLDIWENRPEKADQWHAYAWHAVPSVDHLDSLECVHGYRLRYVDGELTLKLEWAENRRLVARVE